MSKDDYSFQGGHRTKPLCFSFQTIISSVTQQSLTPGSSYNSICLVPFLSRCSTELTFRGETLEALVWKENRIRRRNFGRTEFGLVLTMRRALKYGTEIISDRNLDKKDLSPTDDRGSVYLFAVPIF